MTNNINYKNSILENLIKNQKEHIDLKSKLVLSDLKRITNNLSTDIFCNDCSLWEGPILVANNKEYISFFINGKKVSLHRILYRNYIGNLGENEYLKYSCENKGKCCTLTHFYKINKIAKIPDKEIENQDVVIVEEKPKLKSNLVSF